MITGCPAQITPPSCVSEVFFWSFFLWILAFPAFLFAAVVFFSLRFLRILAGFKSVRVFPELTWGARAHI